MLTHLDQEGRARMVDVSGKPTTLRIARARGVVAMQAATLDLVLQGNMPKGDVLAAMRLAGIMAAKKTWELIPLCHQLQLKTANLEISPLPPEELEIVATVAAVDSTGVEMEALTAVAVAALTAIDMCKAIDRRMAIKEIYLLEKTGGRSGDFRWEEKSSES
ncbi:MAG: cyclic pyranopterin monophosphate synthase MoaC [Selenomonadales bacterium]|nr:cyclic pyranopterin monophosphate synthase MoaC [Selenomonadales bacterium]